MSVIPSVLETLSVEALNPCSVVVLHDDAAASEKATEMCSRLVARFESELAFTLNSWSLSDMGEWRSAQIATDAVAHADIILVATHGWDLPIEAVRWLNYCMEIRTKLEGVLACIVVEPVGPGDALETLLYRLRQVAFGLKMDFLPLVPRLNETEAVMDWTMPLIESREQIGNSHWGLNE